MTTCVFLYPYEFLWATLCVGNHECADIEEVPLAIVDEVGCRFVVGEGEKKCGDIEEVEDAVVGEVGGAGVGCGEYID